MIDEKTLLERAAQIVAPPESVMDGLIRRRDRKRRNQRITAGIVAVMVAVAAIAGAFEIFRRAQQHEPVAPHQVRWTRSFPTLGHDFMIPLAADETGVYWEVDTEPSSHSSLVEIRRYDSAGKLAWSRSLGGDGIKDGVAAALGDGSLYVAFKTPTPDGRPSSRTSSVMRLGLDGRTIWLHGFPPGIDVVWMSRDPDGGVLVGARAGSGNELYRLDPNGDLRGPAVELSGWVVAADASGEYTIGNDYTYGPNGGHPKSDPFLTRYDRAGNELWSRSMQRAADDEFLTLAAAPDGVYVLRESFGKDPSIAGKFVSKYDQSGRLLWTQHARAAFWLAPSSSGGYFLGGVAGDHFPDPSITGYFVAEHGPDGKRLWITGLGEQPAGESAMAFAEAGSDVYVAWEIGPHTYAGQVREAQLKWHAWLVAIGR